MQIFSRQFTSDLLINYVSFTAAAGGGLLFLFLMAHFLGMAGLGVVSLVLALYVVIAQLAVGGIHYSALESASRKHESPKGKVDELWAAILIAGLWGAIVAAMAYLSADLAGHLFSSSEVEKGWRIVSLGLVLFAVNKTSAAILNGLNHMRRFAFQLSLRAILLAGIGGSIAATTKDPVLVCWALLGAELGVTIFLLGSLFGVLGFPTTAAFNRRHLTKHVIFGVRSLWSGLSYEINIRLDVLVVGIFLSDASIGLYALVAQIAEGFLNLLIVIRNQLAPLLGKLSNPLDVNAIQALARRLLITLLPVAAFVAALGLWAYAPVMIWLFPGEGYEAGLPILAILLGGLIMSAWLLVLDTLLVVTGHPRAFSLLMVLVVITNLLANLTLVPILGLIGAALATAISMVSLGLYLTLITRQKLGFWLLISSEA